jgi:hypothetical protein
MCENAGAERHEEVHLLDEREGDLFRLIFKEDDDRRAVA